MRDHRGAGLHWASEREHTVSQALGKDTQLGWRFRHEKWKVTGWPAARVTTRMSLISAAPDSRRRMRTRGVPWGQANCQWTSGPGINSAALRLPAET